MDQAFFRKWIRICLFNLLIVAFLGTLMRYKIAYSLPWLPHKNVENAHSHFAFAGWITQVLMVLMVQYLHQKRPGLEKGRYNLLLYANLLSAWGMLLTFPWEGYGIISIIFSTLSIFVSYVFTVVFWRDLNGLQERNISHLYFKAALIWNVLSSLGAFSLAFMMAAAIRSEQYYLAAIYYYLHFQYNGWFFFACAGLLYSLNTGVSKRMKIIFFLFALSCAPAYLLSVLWAKLPPGVYSLTFLAALMQLAAWVGVLSQLRKREIRLLDHVSKTVAVLFVFSGIAGTVKFILQAGSLHPGMAKIAFGFHPIIIGYLHLVFLGLVTIFIIAFLKNGGLLPTGGLGRKGILLFVAGIILQELLLLVQGMMAMAYQSMPYVNDALFCAAAIMLSGIVLLNLGMKGNTGAAVF